MDTAELDKECAELLPDRQALGCWNYGSHGWYGGHGWYAGCGWYGGHGWYAGCGW